MAEELKDHPILTYMIIVLPMVLLAIGAAVKVNVLLMIFLMAWIGASFMVLFLPIEADNGSSN